MELKGTVTLDEESMEALREEIREEVMENIKQDGLYQEEVLRYLNHCDCKTYAKLLSKTLNDVVEKTDPETITWKDDMKNWKKLQAVRDIWNL